MNVFDTYNLYFKKYFPNLRRSQEDLLQQFEKIRDKYKSIDIEAPPGSGKSLVNMIIAFSEENNFDDIYNKIVISSHTKILQNQYINAFKKLLEDHDIPYAVGLGGNNFICKALNKPSNFCLVYLGLRCKYLPKIIEGTYKKLISSLDLNHFALFGFSLPFAIENPRLKVKAIREDIECPYWQNEYKIFKSKVIFTNHHYLLYHLLFSQTLPAPSVLVIDESHLLPEVFSQIFTIRIDPKIYNFLIENGFISSRSDIISFSNDYLSFIDFLKVVKNYYKEIVSTVKKTKGYLRIRLLKTIETLRIFYLLYKWAIQRKINISKIFILKLYNDTILILPTFQSYLMITDYIVASSKNLVIASSATQLPPGRSISIKRISSYLDMFPPANRPIIYIKDFPNITNNTISDEKVQTFTLQLINTLWKYPPLRRIVIHSTNNFIKEYLGSLLTKYGFPTIVTGNNIHEDFEEWLKIPEGIIISAGLEEGIDLKGDIARVQILIKIPLFDLYHDPFMLWIKKEDPLLYNYYIVRRIVQISGRICRSHDDFGMTIILDKRALDHYNQYAHLYPLYFKVATKIFTKGMLINFIHQIAQSNIFLKKI
ncbi:MAG: helicase C-terminal domain-containing protein [Desulfurococcaceae archaeon]